MILPQCASDYTTLLAERVPFTLSNVGGDGEMLTVIGWKGTNSDGKKSTPEKQKALARCILEPRSTFHGYNPGSAGSDKLKRAESWLRANGVNCPIFGPSKIEDPEYGKARVNVRWVHKEFLATANLRGELGPFLCALRERKPLIIGPSWLGPMARRLNAMAAFFIPPEKGWESLDQIEVQVRAVLSAYSSDGVVTWSLGYLSKVLQWRLIPDYPKLTQIDLGAILDPYCGYRNRSGYKRSTWPLAMEKNLEALA